MTDPNMPDSLEGVVIRSTGSWYDVQVGDRIISCKTRGRFRLDGYDSTNPVAVGDRVIVQSNEDTDDATGLVTHVRERTNWLARRAAGHRANREHVIVANIDRAWIIQSLRMPDPNPGFIDRILVTAEANEIPAGLVLNKADLLEGYDDELSERLRETYENLGYPVLVTSALTGEGTEAFRNHLAGKTSVLIGPSGTGKSSLLNMVEPGLDVRTSYVSPKTRKGRHTTAYVSLFPLSGGGYVADTPGVREFGVLHIEPWELSHHFGEFRPHIERCRFPTCTHDHEPGCAVKHGIERGAVSGRRYRSYLNILESIRSGV